MSEASDQPPAMARLTGDNPQATLLPLFKPPAGGDLTLRSSDEVDFHVHSIILKLASSVFSDMISTSSTKDPVILSENAAALSLILQFIYPNTKPPAINSLDVLSNCLTIAQKYDLASVIEYLDDQVALSETGRDLISKDPLNMYQLAIQFDLPNAKRATAALVAGSTDFSKPDEISQLVQAHSPSVLLRVVALQNTRARVLSETLFSFNKHPMQHRSDFLYYDLSCDNCQPDDPEEDTPQEMFTEVHKHVPATWTLAWARLVYQELLSAPIADSDALFEVGVLSRLEGQIDVCQGCLDEFWRIKSRRPRFNEWAQEVKDVLEDRLKAVEYLYPL